MYCYLCFRSLDLSFNRIKEIKSLDTLTCLQKLYLIQNKIGKIENLGHLTELQMLELGANRIRVCNVAVWHLTFTAQGSTSVDRI